MEVSRIRALRGPNLWSRHTAIEAIVACRADENARSTDLPGFEAAAARAVPGHRRAAPGRLGQPLSLAHVLEAAALALQAQAGCPVTFSRTARHASRPASTRSWSSTAKKRSAGWRSSWRSELIDAALATTAASTSTPRSPSCATLDEDERLGPSTGCHRRRRRGARHSRTAA